MKKLTSYNRVTQYLVKIFKMINERYFNKELEIPTLTIQSSRGTYGHITTHRVWLASEDKFTYSRYSCYKGFRN